MNQSAGTMNQYPNLIELIGRQSELQGTAMWWQQAIGSDELSDGAGLDPLPDARENFLQDEIVNGTLNAVSVSGHEAIGQDELDQQIGKSVSGQEVIGQDESSTLGFEAIGQDESPNTGFEAIGQDESPALGFEAIGQDEIAPLGFEAIGQDEIAPMGFEAMGQDESPDLGFEAIGQDEIAPSRHEVIGQDETPPIQLDAMSICSDEVPFETICRCETIGQDEVGAT
ncbi:MAG: hypothetical protein ABI705_00860 [Aestuariivirga sp.]